MRRIPQRLLVVTLAIAASSVVSRSKHSVRRTAAVALRPTGVGLWLPEERR